MKRKINIQLLALVALAMSATLIMVVGVFYRLFQDEVVQDLAAYTQLLGNSGVFGQEEQKLKITESDIRVTLIKQDGTVYYDSSVNPEKMENHSDRPEFIEAVQTGKGDDVRCSKTLDKNTFYCALQLENGMVLRTAKDSKSILSVFESTFPLIGIFIVIVFGICMILAHFMTKSLVAPIEQLAKDVEECDSISTYKELVPFINTIQKQHDDIIQGAQMRQEFTANVSHELKTPLTAISGYAELIESGMASGEDMRHFASEIHQNSNRLLTLINDIIQLSELDCTEVEISFEMVDLYQVARRCIEMLQITAAQNNIKLTLEGTPCIISANKAMMEEVIVNLCDNAIRYNNKNGEVKVTIRPVNDKVVLSIRDTGIGISKENQQRIFERFYRVDKSRSKSTGGTGLGLAIVKHIIGKHHASLEVESELGKGTEIKAIFNGIEKSKEA